MSGTIVRYDGSGAVAPDNLQARARPPPTAAAGAPTTRKRPCAQAAADGRLLRAVPRPAGTAKGMHPRDLSRLMQAFMWPAIPGAKWMDILVRSLTGSEDACAVFLENDSPTGGPPFTPPAPFRRPWRRTESPSLSAPSGVASLAPRLPTGTRAMPSATSCLTRRRPAASHQRTMWSSAAGAAARRRTPTLSPRCAPSAATGWCRLAARSVRASRQGQSRHRHHHASDECHPPAHLVAVGRPPLGGRLAALGGTEAAALSCPGLI